MSLQALSVSHTVFDPTWLDPVAGSRVDSARGVTQVGSNTRVLRASSEPGRVKYTFFIYARLGLNVLIITTKLVTNIDLRSYPPSPGDCS